LGHVRIALAISAKYDLEIHQMDICTAFLGVDSGEEIYMHPPQGYCRLLQNGRLIMTSRKMVLHMRKSLYGLKQSLHVWNGNLKDPAIWIGFMASPVDRRHFVLPDKDQYQVVALVILYVNGLLIIGNEYLIGQSNDQMKLRF
jgi:hypothetical protein